MAYTVVQLWKEACMFVEGEFIKENCTNEFAFNMGIMMAADPLQVIMRAALSGVQRQPKKDDLDDPIAMLEKELMHGDPSGDPNGFDPLSALKEVRGEGTRLDLGTVSLSPGELNMVTLGLTVRL